MFLRSAAVVSAALVFKPGSFVYGQSSQWSNNPVKSTPSVVYRREMFEPYVGDMFRVRVGKQMVALKLVALENFAPASRGITTGRVTRTDCFSMRFHATTPLPASAQTLHLNHSKLGNFDLFTSQSKNGRMFVHTAVVNHFD